MADQGISTSFYVAVQALAEKCGTPLPKGVNTAEVGDWTLAINNGDAPAYFNGHSLNPFEVYAASKTFVAFALFGPSDGFIGGLPEDAFIADMAAAGYSA